MCVKNAQQVRFSVAKDQRPIVEQLTEGLDRAVHGAKLAAIQNISDGATPRLQPTPRAPQEEEEAKEAVHEARAAQSSAEARGAGAHAHMYTHTHTRMHDQAQASLGPLVVNRALLSVLT